MNTTTPAFWEQLTEIRRQLHRSPELSFKETETTRLLSETLERWGLNFRPFKNLNSGGFCDIGKGKIYAFRSDIDALPITENSEHEVISQIPGLMHACGHDFHTAIGLGLLKYFTDNPALLKGRLRVIFQPGEEAAPGGAEKVINEPIWNHVRGILTVHVTPQTPVGKFLLFQGPVQASSTSLLIELNGPGGHTSKPFETSDLIYISSRYIGQVQTFIQQKTDPRETLAFAFGSVHGGATHNIIPQQVQLRGTIRTLDNQLLKETLSRIRSFSDSFAKLYGIQINVRFPTTCPATINDSVLSRLFLKFMEQQGAAQAVVQPGKPSMGADDFAFYTRIIPGLYLLTGGGKGILHSGNLELDEALLQPTVETLAGFLSFLFEKGRLDL